jgi:hypothetical protein
MIAAFKTFSECPEEFRPIGVNLNWPWVEEITDSLERVAFLQERGYHCLTEDQYMRYKQSISPVLKVIDTINDAAAFGQAITSEFAAENVLMGITQLNMTGVVMTALADVNDALLTGSLYEAISRIKALPSTAFDNRFITPDRLLVVLNKIENYLGIPLST